MDVGFAVREELLGPQDYVGHTVVDGKIENDSCPSRVAKFMNKLGSVIWDLFAKVWPYIDGIGWCWMRGCATRRTSVAADVPEPQDMEWEEPAGDQVLFFQPNGLVVN